MGVQRRVSLRFVWQMDAATHLHAGADELRPLVGPEERRLAQPPLGADRGGASNSIRRGRSLAALQARVTWSGIVVQWPVDDDDRAVADRVVRIAGVRP